MIIRFSFQKKKENKSSSHKKSHTYWFLFFIIIDLHIFPLRGTLRRRRPSVKIADMMTSDSIFAAPGIALWGKPLGPTLSRDGAWERSLGNFHDPHQPLKQHKTTIPLGIVFFSGGCGNSRGY